MKTILIIGITGFLGRNLAKILWYNYKDKYKIIGTGLSPNKIALFKSTRREWGAIENDIPCYMLDICHDLNILESIFKKYNVDYIVHAAALKYMDIAEKDPCKTIDINIIGTKNIIHLANKYNVTNLIALSTDKANKPVNTYGYTKYLMEQMILHNNYTIYQGVNFFWSDGSVLDIWYRQIKKNEKISITDLNQERYFSNINDICNDIISNLNNKDIIYPTNIFKIKLYNLFNSMIKYFNYNKDKCFVMGYRINEKQKEDLNIDDNFHELTEEEILNLIDYTIKNIDLSFI